ncbi:MAG: ribosome hibernation-promoting factor, HPF/YfiA family [Dehalococcoidia bacterium]
MELLVTSKNVEISEAVEKYLERKLGKLARHLPAINESKVEISREKAKSPDERYVVQVTVNSRGTLLRAECQAAVLDAAIDSVSDVLARQIERYKGKLHERRRKTSQAKRQTPPSEIAETAPPRHVAKEKRFVVKPMSLEEATEQMELLGHDFFLFLGTDSGRLRVIYRRRDGGYGLIEPEME